MSSNSQSVALLPALIEERGADPLHDFLAGMGGWPVLDPNWASTDDFSWQDLVAELRLLNNRVLINMWVSADDKNSSANIVQVSRIIFTCFLCGRVDQN